MKSLLLTTFAILGLFATSQAQYVKFTNNTDCDQYVTAWAWPTISHMTPTSDYTTVMVISANSSVGWTGVGSLPWRGSGVACGWQIGISVTEDLTCGTGGTGTITWPNGGSDNYITTCTSNPSCPYDTHIQVSAACGSTQTNPMPNAPCGTGPNNGGWDMEFIFSY